jgi:hypothetical protein
VSAPEMGQTRLSTGSAASPTLARKSSQLILPSPSVSKRAMISVASSAPCVPPWPNA